jgi:hypothetical protein
VGISGVLAVVITAALDAFTAAAMTKVNSAFVKP